MHKNIIPDTFEICIPPASKKANVVRFLIIFFIFRSRRLEKEYLKNLGLQNIVAAKKSEFA